MRLARLGLLAIAFAVVPGSESLARGTWTVAQSGPADFSEISDAVNAASDGDVIVVAFGAYQPFIVDGKGLAIVAPSGASLVTTSFGPSGDQGALITIRNLAASQRCVIEHLALTNFSVATAALLVRDCAGPVWLQHLFVDSYNATSIGIERSSAVVLTDCFAQTNLGPAAPDGTPQPLPGYRVVESRAWFSASSASGSHGNMVGAGFPTPNAPAPGGPGIEVIDSFVDYQGGEIHGGSGNSMLIGGCMHAGDGGPGLLLSTTGASSGPPLVRLRGTSVTGGNGGFFHVACAPAPATGPAQLVLAGSVDTLPGPARTIEADGVADSGTTYSIALKGAASDQALLFAGTAAPPTTLPGPSALAMHLAAPPAFLAVLPIPAQGVLALEFVLPPQAPGTPVAVGALQGIFVATGGSLVASGPLAIALR